MRLWHKELIPYLPQKQLVAQWRECCCIARNIAIDGTPNHILVNKIMDYPIGHFWFYTNCVIFEMKERGYNVDVEKFLKWYRKIENPLLHFETYPEDEIYKDWHNDRYFKQCFYNLQEKYDCGGISEVEWDVINSNLKIKRMG